MPISVNGRCYCQADVICLVWNVADVIAICYLLNKVLCVMDMVWSALIIVILKGDVGKCLVIDYSALNKVTQKFVWPIPRVEDIFSKLNGAKYLSTLNLHVWYHHISLMEDSISKNTFTSPFGKYEYLKVPFGLAQAPAYF